ncbi:MAG: bacteriophage abortive infection AbiH family protein [Muribaculum sp.]|nr:bacteriophage abortive infection AbiH family protein [Muribaculum sp.]
MKTVVIIGNGFDLNLGMPTSYRDFIESPECQQLIRNRENYIINRIYNNYRLVNWTDIENELKNFAQEFNIKITSTARIKREYLDIVYGLRNYLYRIQKESDLKDTLIPLHVNSHAGRMLNLICKYPKSFEVFNFNYTSLAASAKKLGYIKDETILPCEHVHGSIANKDIIVGFEDYADNVEAFSYMIKTFNVRYHHGANIRKSLSEATDVIIFGHSLGSTDYQYFQQFFSDISDSSNKKKYPVRIYIVTASEESKNQIFDQLRNMNHKNTNILYTQNRIRTFCTTDFKSMLYFYHTIKEFQYRIEAENILFEN